MSDGVRGYDVPAGLTEAQAADLWRCWMQPHRRYHTTDHLLAVLASVDTLAGSGVEFDVEAVRLAAWFHDAVYEIGAADNEEASARLAETMIDDTAVAAEVARLVRITATHVVGPDDRNGAALCDADLSVLASDPAGYAAYTHRVRAEYAAVPDELFAPGRCAVLTRMLDQGSLFHTPFGREHWEQPARANVRAEIETLTAASR